MKPAMTPRAEYRAKGQRIMSVSIRGTASPPGGGEATIGRLEPVRDVNRESSGALVMGVLGSGEFEPWAKGVDRWLLEPCA